jgi:hypothetical protein
MLWGFENGDLSFQEAIRRNHPRDWTISQGERRAVQLLFQLVDHERATRYLITGEIYARGNITGTLYKVQRCAPNVLEYNTRGRICATWCVHADGGSYFTPTMDDSRLPKTDEVIALRNLIEGEETRFRTTGNRTALRPHDKYSFNPLDSMQKTPNYKLRGVVDPYAVDFMSGMMPLICEAAAVELVARKTAEDFNDMNDFLAPGDFPAFGADGEVGFYHGGNYQQTLAPRGERRFQRQGILARLKKGGTVDIPGARSMHYLDALAEAALSPKQLKCVQDRIESDDVEAELVLAARERQEPSIL